MECVYKASCETSDYCSVYLILEHKGSPTAKTDTMALKVVKRMLFTADNIRDGNDTLEDHNELQGYRNVFEGKDPELTSSLLGIGKNKDLLELIDTLNEEISSIEKYGVSWQEYFNTLGNYGLRFFQTVTHVPDEQDIGAYGYAYVKFLTMRDSLNDLDEDIISGAYNPLKGLGAEQMSEFGKELETLRIYLITQREDALKETKVYSKVGFYGRNSWKGNGKGALVSQ
jgi:hypothetical protein